MDVLVSSQYNEDEFLRSEIPEWWDLVIYIYLNFFLSDTDTHKVQKHR